MTYLRQITPKTSEYLFSGFQASLADTAEIDSGWLDMEEFDKYQFEGRSGTAGMTQIITSSRVDGGGQPDDIVTTNVIDNSTFQLFNVICRQRFIRFQWRNDSGGVISPINVSTACTLYSSSTDEIASFAASCLD